MLEEATGGVEALMGLPEMPRHSTRRRRAAHSFACDNRDMTGDAGDLPDVSGLELGDAKTTLRRAIRSRRAAIHRHPESGHTPVCDALAEHVLEATAGMRSVAAYVSTANEPCTRVLLEELHAAGITVLLPVLGPHLSRAWGEYSTTTELTVRAPGRPPEPSGDILPAEAVAQVDGLIIPALAVDREGRRLGQGGGWYDRIIPLRKPGAGIFAVVHDDELLPGPLPSEEHDQRVEVAITPERWFLIEGSAFQREA